ncbi:hypothetical protein AB1Y20_015008 [Prymnesium parvum]|uniref:Uncharacterized protein n=1 Tax=Prymnesium parvum TaxID=97485 RepID=A0AB34JWK4_PRYPA
MALSLESLRAQLVHCQARISELEHSLGQAARDSEHVHANQRRAQRHAEDCAQRAEIAERQLELTRRELARAKEALEQLELCHISAADDHAAERRKALQQLLLLARACRDHEEQADAAHAREAALRQHCVEAERWATESATRLAASEQQMRSAAAAAAAREKELLQRVEEVEAQSRQGEAVCVQREANLSRETAEAKERMRVAESHAAAMEVARDECEARLQTLTSEIEAMRDKLAQAVRQQAAEHFRLRSQLTTLEQRNRQLEAALAESEECGKQSASIIADRDAELISTRQMLGGAQAELARRREQMQRTALIGSQLQGIQHLLSELGATETNFI